MLTLISLCLISCFCKRNTSTCSALAKEVVCHACKTGFRPLEERQYNIRNTAFNMNLPDISF